MPGFAFSGDTSMGGASANAYRVYIATDRDCVNIVFRGDVVGSPAYAPRVFDAAYAETRRTTGRAAVSGTTTGRPAGTTGRSPASQIGFGWYRELARPRRASGRLHRRPYRVRGVKPGIPAGPRAMNWSRHPRSLVVAKPTFKIVVARLSELARVEPLLAVARDAVGRRAGPARHDLAQLGADVVEPDAVVRRDALREAAVDELAVARAAAAPRRRSAGTRCPRGSRGRRGSPRAAGRTSRSRRPRTSRSSRR